MKCRCWECRRAQGPACVAPTLAAAWLERLRLAPERLELTQSVVRLRRLVAHRELQRIRAGSIGGRSSASYVHKRELKLKEARAWLSAAERRLEEVK